MIIDESLITESFVRASGPGGQNVNKVATAVELRFDLAKATLPEAVRARAQQLAGHRLTGDGVIVIHAHEHRTQSQNREAARARLEDILARASRAPKSRRRTRPTAAARERRLQGKQRRSAVKRQRSNRRHDD